MQRHYIGKGKIPKLALILVCCFVMLSLGSPLAVTADDSQDYEDDLYADEPEQQSSWVDDRAQQDEARRRQVEAQIAEKNAKKKELDAKKSGLKKSIEETSNKKDAELKRRATVDTDIYYTREQIGETEEKISLQEELIQIKIRQIEDKLEEHENKKKLYIKRMQSIQVQNKGTRLGLLLATSSFQEFLTREVRWAAIADHDEQLMKDLRRQKVALDEERAGLEATKQDLEEERQEHKTLEEKLATQRAAISREIQNMDQLKKMHEQDLAAVLKESKKMEAEIQSLYDSLVLSQDPYVGGAMKWPMPGYSKITSPYGKRWGDFHTGLDISGTGIYGKPIVAAQDGTVAMVNFSHKAGSGYGIYVMLDHGGGITTLYAHCSNILVSQGQTVTKGQPIAEVGSTGWSTGPHLHFEVRKGKQHTNPMSYLQG